MRGPMSAFRDLRVSAKLALSFGLVLLLALVIGLVGVNQLGAAQDRLRGMYRDSSRPSTGSAWSTPPTSRPAGSCSTMRSPPPRPR